MQITSVHRWMLTKWTHTRVKKQNSIKTLGDPPGLCRLPLPGSMSALPTLTSMNSFRLFLNFVSVEPNSMYPFVSSLFRSASCLQDSSMSLHAGEVHFGSVLLLFLCVILPQFTCALQRGMWGIFSEGFLWRVLHKHTSTCPWGVELLAIGTCMFNVSRSFQWMYPFYTPTSNGQVSVPATPFTCLPMLRFCLCFSF